jgi:hypothetical protein
LGYQKTFETVARALIASLKTKDDAEMPYYSEINVASLRDMRMGYSIIEMRRDKDGDTKFVETDALLFTADSESLQARDDVHVDWIKPDGALINSKRVTSSNGEIEMDLALKPSDGANWQVEGKFKGKDVKETISGGVPSTWLSQTNMLRGLLAKEDPIGAESSQSDWLGVDPGRLTETRMRVLAAIDAKTYSVRQTAANTSADLVVDRTDGSVTRGIMQVGPVAITFDRVYVQGSP